MWAADGRWTAVPAKQSRHCCPITCSHAQHLRLHQGRATQGCLPPLLQGTGLQLAVRKVQLLIRSSRLTSKLHVEVEVDPVRAVLQGITPAQQGQHWEGVPGQCALPCIHCSLCR